ncbi:CD226 antigen isoform X1 [Pongo abelii]|uniref:CD226 antigen n=6 Tax=Pongo abelii TaxID=9601 RepID=A0A6D2X5X4_PONAB|nr:CD226 isoform 2 [Pongo abelii]PNJ64422.1 CD226 isoform 5 [Pongo abelii]
MDYPTLLLALLHVYRALCEEVLWHTSVPFAENMSLECVYPSMGILTQVEWFKIGTEKDSIAIFSPTHGMVIRKPYAERVYFLNSTMASNNMTLFFRNASEDDVGYYSCSLYTYPQGTWQKVIQVVQSDSFEAAVPSNSHIISEPGKNITLTCQPQMTRPVQEVRWEKIQPHQIDLLTYCNLVHGRNFTSKFPRQIVSNCSHGRWSIIVIPDVTASDSGLYHCHLQASAGENETFVMRLTVAEGKTDNQYTLFVAGGTVLLLLFLISITTIIVIFLNRRRRRERRDLFTESWDTQKAPNNYRSPISTSQPTNQSMDDAREDVYVNYPTFSRRPKTRV